MKYKIQYSFQLITREVDEHGREYLGSDCMYQKSTINEDLPFEEQVKTAQRLVEMSMRTLRKEHEKDQNKLL